MKINMNFGVSLLEKILRLYKKYGTFSILKGLCLIILLSISLRICYNPDFLFERYQKYVITTHTEDVNIRTQYDSQIKSLLPSYLYKYRANRIWIIQYHNGVMDWQHGTMRFEQCTTGVRSIQNQYNDFNLTWLNMPYYLIDNNIFIGDIEQVYNIDRTLYTQLEKNNIKYLACILLRDTNGYPIGILGATWEKIPEDIDTFKNQIYEYLISDTAEIKYLLQR